MVNYRIRFSLIFKYCWLRIAALFEEEKGTAVYWGRTARLLIR